MQEFIVYVDVDDTIVRTFSGKRIRIPSSIEHIKELKKQGAIIYCWSSGGAGYARMVAEELNILDLFIAFLPKPNMLLDDQSVNDWKYLLQKPNMLLDDQSVNDWKYLLQVHPLSCDSKGLDAYRQQLLDKALRYY